eukprot:jgi/Bigna1/136447/aug1.34_g11155
MGEKLGGGVHGSKPTLLLQGAALINAGLMGLQVDLKALRPKAAQIYSSTTSVMIEAEEEEVEEYPLRSYTIVDMDVDDYLFILHNLATTDSNRASTSVDVGFDRLRSLTFSAISVIPRVADIVLFLFLFVCFFSVFGVFIFRDNVLISSAEESHQYFNTFEGSFISLFILFTSANNPDVMLPAYRDKRAFVIFFSVFIVVSIFFISNLILANVFDAYRQVISIQARDFQRNRLRAFRSAFKLLLRHREHEEEEEEKKEKKKKKKKKKREIPRALMHKVLAELRKFKTVRFPKVPQISGMDEKAVIELIITAMDQREASLISWQEFMTLPFILSLSFRPAKEGPHHHNTPLLGKERIAAERMKKESDDENTAAEIKGRQQQQQQTTMNMINRRFVKRTKRKYSTPGHELEESLHYTKQQSNAHDQKENNTTNFVTEGGGGGGGAIASSSYSFSSSSPSNLVSQREKIFRCLRPMFLGWKYELAMCAFVVLEFLLIVAELERAGQPREQYLALEMQKKKKKKKKKKKNVYVQMMLHQNLPRQAQEDTGTVGGAFVVVFQLLVVNNWQILMDGTVEAARSRFPQLYFISFYLVAVVIVLNIVVAVMLSITRKMEKGIEARRSKRKPVCVFTMQQKSSRPTTDGKGEDWGEGETGEGALLPRRGDGVFDVKMVSTINQDSDSYYHEEGPGGGGGGGSSLTASSHISTRKQRARSWRARMDEKHEFSVYLFDKQQGRRSSLLVSSNKGGGGGGGGVEGGAAEKMDARRRRRRKPVEGPVLAEMSRGHEEKNQTYERIRNRRGTRKNKQSEKDKSLTKNIEGRYHDSSSSNFREDSRPIPPGSTRKVLEATRNRTRIKKRADVVDDRDWDDDDDEEEEEENKNTAVKAADTTGMLATMR